MSSDTPDPERATHRPGEPGPAGAEPRPESPPVDPPAGLPAPAGTPAGAPGTQPFPWAGPGAEHRPVTIAGPAVTARPARGVRRAVGLTVGVAFLLTVLGAPLGLLWTAVAPDIPVVKTAEGAIYATPQPEQPIAADGWFSVLGLGFGVLAAIALWFLLRRRRGPVGLLAGTLGGLGAAVVAWQVGRRIGLSTYQRLLETAPDGQPFTKPADLRAGGVDWFVVPHGNLLLPAFGAAVTYTLLAGWSRWPSLRPEPEPYGAWPPPAAGAGGWGVGPTEGLSSAPADRPARSAAPEPPGPGAAEPPRG
ncbi:DUF2567 domain-containing protein [Micromonospora sp. NBC_00898]|uniref:DUF2567 domain-containing protein n=1 Tax=Micromonospora sp. NBC_00898 TaxID=2975981 RepID=UPI0038677A4A